MIDFEIKNALILYYILFFSFERIENLMNLQENDNQIYENIRKKFFLINNNSLENSPPRMLAGCSSGYNCYKCNSINNCFWCVSSCYQTYMSPCGIDSSKYVSNVQTNNNWFVNFYNYCSPSTSICGKTTYDLSQESVNINLINNMDQSETCYWIITNDNKKDFAYNLTRKGYSLDRLSIVFIDDDGTTDVTYKYIYDSSIGTTNQVIDLSYKNMVVFYQNLASAYSNSFSFNASLSSTPIKPNDDSDNNTDKNSDNSNTGISVVMIIIVVISSITGVLGFIIGFRFICIYCCKWVSQVSDENQNNNRNNNNNNNQDPLRNFKEATAEDCMKYEQKDCTICLLPNDGCERIVSSPCHHYFHYNCIKNWVGRRNTKPTCPNCNYDLHSNDIVPIHAGYLEKERQRAKSRSQNDMNNNLWNVPNLFSAKAMAKCNSPFMENFNPNRNFDPHVQIVEDSLVDINQN